MATATAIAATTTPATTNLAIKQQQQNENNRNNNMALEINNNPNKNNTINYNKINNDCLHLRPRSMIHIRDYNSPVLFAPATGGCKRGTPAAEPPTRPFKKN